MSQASRRSAALLAVVLVVSACSGERPLLLSEEPTTTTTTTVAPGPAEVSAERRVSEFEIAVNNLIDAATYRFESMVTIDTGDTLTDIEIGGWVDGADRELILRTAAGEVITRVVDGVATVERDGQTVTVPLKSASTEPSLAVLSEIVDISYAPGDILQGRLTERSLQAVGFEVVGSAKVTATILNGYLEHYTITADTGAWSIRTQFSGIGAVTD